MCNPVTSMEEIIEAIKEGVRSANLSIRDSKRKNARTQEAKTQTQGQTSCYLDGEQIADIIQKSICDKCL